MLTSEILFIAMIYPTTSLNTGERGYPGKPFLFSFLLHLPMIGPDLWEKNSGSRAYIILPSDRSPPAVSAASDCCHFGVIVCLMHLQISAFKTEKWTRKRTSTSE